MFAKLFVLALLSSACIQAAESKPTYSGVTKPQQYGQYGSQSWTSDSSSTPEASSKPEKPLAPESSTTPKSILVKPLPIYGGHPASESKSTTEAPSSKLNPSFENIKFSYKKLPFSFEHFNNFQSSESVSTTEQPSKESASPSSSKSPESSELASTTEEPSKESSSTSSSESSESSQSASTNEEASKESASSPSSESPESSESASTGQEPSKESASSSSSEAPEGTKKPTKPSGYKPDKKELKFIENIKKVEKKYSESVLKLQQDYENAISRANQYYFETGSESKYWELVLEANANRQEELVSINENFINERDAIIKARSQ